jgi:hypothetical protein
MLIRDLRIRLDFGELVKIDETKTRQLAEFVKTNDIFREYKPYDWSDYDYWLPNSEGEKEVSQFFALGNAINFRYWNLENGTFTYWNGKKRGIPVRGARFMWRSLKTAYDNEKLNIFDVGKLAKLKSGQLSEIFCDDQGKNPIPHLEERSKNWSDLGLKLYEYWDGEFYNVIKESKGSLKKFVQLSRQFRAFDDPLCKMTMVNSILHSGRGLVNFQEKVIPGIDYQLMKENLRIGVLKPDDEIADKIRNMDLLEEHEARELRNACLQVFLDVMQNADVDGEILDNRWWLNSKYCTDDSPVCQNPENAGKCIFLDICEKNADFRIPLENTRYY